MGLLVPEEWPAFRADGRCVRWLRYGHGSGERVAESAQPGG